MSAARHFGVFEPGRIGDFITTTSLFNAIKATDPAATITAVVAPRVLDLATVHPAIDRIVVYPRDGLRWLPFLRRLWAQRFDVWIDPKARRSRNAILVATLARARIKIGWNGRYVRPFDHDLAVGWTNAHRTAMVLRPLALLGGGFPTEVPMSVGLTEAAVEWATTAMRGQHQWRVFVNLSASKPGRYWTIDRWVAFLVAASALRPTTFFVSAAPDDEHLTRGVVDAAVAQGVEAKPLVFDSLVKLGAVVAAADLVVTPDTSIVHFASAFDRPILALYRGLEENLVTYAPLSTFQEVIVSSRHERVDTIQPEHVAAAYRRLLQRLSHQPVVDH